jgi:hypothetical protein
MNRGYRDLRTAERRLSCLRKYVWRLQRGRNLPDLIERVMRMSSSLVARSARAVLSTVLLSGPAMSRTEPSSAPTALPSITVQAPKPVARSQRSQQRAVTRNTLSRTVSRGTSPTAGEESVLEKLRRIERGVSSCDGGCQSSLPSRGRPWVGCSGSAWPMGSSTCKNGRNYKSYVECTEASYFLAWKPMEVWWYCSSLAFNK